MGCKKAGYVGNATRLWAAINEAGSEFLWGGKALDLFMIVIQWDVEIPYYSMVSFGVLSHFNGGWE